MVMVMAPFRRRGIAEGYTYTAVVYPANDGWRWTGHECPSIVAGSDVGPIVASGGPFEFDTQATRGAEHWFESIPHIVELGDSIVEVSL